MDYSSGESTRVLSVDTPHIPRSDIIDFGKFPELLKGLLSYVTIAQ